MKRKSSFYPLAVATIISLTTIADVCAAQAPPGMSNETIDTLNAAVKLYSADKFLEASEKYQQVCDATPNFEDAWEFLGYCLVQLRQPQRALDAMLKADALNPNQEDVVANLATLYQNLGKPNESLVQCKRYLSLYPKGRQAELMRNLSNVVETEAKRSAGIPSSAGQDNYLPEAMQGGAARFKQSSMPITVFIHPGTGRKGYKPEWDGILKQAFQSWSEATKGIVTVKFVNESGAAINCMWTDDLKDMINGGEDGLSGPSYSTKGELIGSEIFLLTKNPMRGHDTTDDEIRMVALHEIGHSLGLMGHSTQQSDVMFSSASSSNGLSDRDKKTLSDLYNAPESYLAEHPIKLNDGFVGNESNPKNLFSKLNLEGVTAFNAGQYETAITSYLAALKVYPEGTFIYRNLGAAYLGIANKALNKDDTLAELNYNKAIENFTKGGARAPLGQIYDTLIEVSKIHHNDEMVKKYSQLKVEAQASK